MAVLVQEPADSLPGTGDWQQQLRRTSLSLRGFFALDVTEKSTGQFPSIIAGSMFEMDDSLWRVPDAGNQVIRWGAGIGGNTFVFCYAQQIDAESVEFVWRADEPEYDAVRMGWYSSAAPGRCVLSAYRTQGASVLCKALRGADFVSKQTHSPPATTPMRILFVSGNVLTQSVRVQPGWYSARLSPGRSAIGLGDIEGRWMGIDFGPFDDNQHNIWIGKPGTLNLTGGRNVIVGGNPFGVFRGGIASLDLDGETILRFPTFGRGTAVLENTAVPSDVHIM